MSWWVLISHCSFKRGWATVGKFFKDRMRGGGMQPLVLIRQYTVGWVPDRNTIKNASLVEAFVVIAAHLIMRVKVITISLWTQDLLIWGPTAFSISTAFLNNNDYYRQYAELKATWLPGETGPVWREEEEEEKEEDKKQCMGNSGFPHSTVRLTLTHNNLESRNKLCMEPIFQGCMAEKHKLTMPNH